MVDDKLETISIISDGTTVNTKVTNSEGIQLTHLKSIVIDLDSAVGVVTAEAVFYGEKPDYPLLKQQVAIDKVEIKNRLLNGNQEI